MTIQFGDMTIQFGDMAVQFGDMAVQFDPFPPGRSPVPSPAAAAVPPAAVLTAEEAARFISEDTAWPPGWTVTAQALPQEYKYGFTGSNDVNSLLKVTLEKQGRNSSLPAGDGSYPEPWTLQWPLGVPDFALAGYDALMYWVLEKITWCEEHEAREFCRYKKDGAWHAPFHPHRGSYRDQHQTPEWQAQYRDPADHLIAGRR